MVSLNFGDTCRFRFGNPDRRGKPFTNLDLVSGDDFVFGQQSRYAYHGVPQVRPDTADPASRLTQGRINITMRMTGLG